MSGRDARLRELTAGLEELARRRRETRLAYYRPYRKQREFHALGATKRERLFLAGNQLGKTTAGGFEMAYHLTGRYPDWWEGRRFVSPIKAWAGSNTGETTRDNAQRVLLGPPFEFGTGAIPKDAIVNPRMSRGLADAVDTVAVKHVSGGLSSLGFKSYERGREKWQGETLHVVWEDEEPPASIHSEALARVTATKGLLFITATPLLGMTTVIAQFLEQESPDRGSVRMEIDEAEHIPAEEREKIIAGYLPHERDARTKGIPIMGSGRVFPVPEDMIAEDAVEIGLHWRRICGLDIGWDHPTAAVWIAHDPDTDTVHVYDCYAQSEQTVAVHAASIRKRGAWIPVAWPQDALKHDPGRSGQRFSQLYRDEGLNMLHEHAQFEEGGYGMEAGIADMLDRMMTGRFKVAKHLEPWWREFRGYHRKDGVVVKERDDLMSATRYAIMMLRCAVSAARHQKGRAPLEYKFPGAPL